MNVLNYFQTSFYNRDAFVSCVIILHGITSIYGPLRIRSKSEYPEIENDTFFSRHIVQTTKFELS